MLLQSMLQGWINYTAGERGDSLSFLQPVEMDYLQDLEKHGVSLTEYLLLKVLDSFPLSGQKHHIKKFISLEKHIWLLYWQKALESFIFAEVQVNNNLCKIFFFFFFFFERYSCCLLSCSGLYLLCFCVWDAIYRYDLLPPFFSSCCVLSYSDLHLLGFCIEAKNIDIS